MKKFLSLVTAIVMTVSLCIMPVYAQTYEEAAADAQNAEINYNRSVPLEVKGNKIVKQGTDEMVVLRGVNVPSMDRYEARKKIVEDLEKGGFLAYVEDHEHNVRSEERRVGKECRSRWSPYH